MHRHTPVSPHHQPETGRVHLTPLRPASHPPAAGPVVAPTHLRPLHRQDLQPAPLAEPHPLEQAHRLTTDQELSTLSQHRSR